MSSDRIVLSYNDSLLHESDVQLLESNNWLNDRIIGFTYEYFEQDVYKTDKIAFVNPSTVQFLKLCASLEEAKMCFLEPLGLDQKELIFFPINNNRDVNTQGGSHWSLLIFNKSILTFTHLDSCMESNSREALSFYQKYKEFFNAKCFRDEKNCPQQKNSSDCGVYVLALTDLFASVFNEKSEKIKYDLVTPQAVTDLRKRLKNVILNLSK